jgi:Arc/MetJ-type ribon-helix-helix transcriptional regulator
MTPTKKNESPLVRAAVALMEARNIGMVTSEEWENLAKAVEAESGEKIEWRTDDEIADAEEKAG